MCSFGTVSNVLSMLSNIVRVYQEDRSANSPFLSQLLFLLLNLIFRNLSIVTRAVYF